MMTQSHPTPEALSDFVQGRLEEVELEQVSAHLDACSACQRTLDQLSRANDTLIGKVREAGAAIEPQPGEVSTKGPVAPTRPKPLVAPREPAATPGLVIKPITWEQVQQILTDLELVSSEDLATLHQQLLAASSKELGSDALRELTDQGKLTKYQAQAIFQGKAHLLSYGEYTVLDRLGAGGMGQVFKAVHRRMRRIVALKVLSSSALKNPEAVRRFEREATAAAKLSHPAIVSAYDLNSHGKTSFLVMEYIEGRDLSKIVDSKGPLPVNTAIDYILQAAEALAFAHSHGIIHRDIKPANLLIDREGRLKVLDLGLAKFEGAGGESARTQLTVTAQVMGTVDYMAPEQALNTKKAEARSDIYSLGCTLYRLLTNESVYDGETITERFLNHREAPIPSLRALRPDVPESLDELFRYMVGKKPEDRPATMDEVVKALQNIALKPSLPMSIILPPTAVSKVSRTVVPPPVIAPPIVRAFESTASGIPMTSLTLGVQPPPLPSAFEVVDDNSSWLTQTTARPPRHRGSLGLIAAGGVAALLMLLGIVVIVRDRHGEVVSQVRVPRSGTVEIAPTVQPTIPIQPTVPPQPTPPNPETPTPSSPTAPTAITKTTGAQAPDIAKAPFDAEKAKAHQEAWSEYMGTSLTTVNSLDMNLVLIPPGEFQMGAGDGGQDEKPVHTVKITKPFYFGMHEVTQQSWTELMGDKPWNQMSYIQTGPDYPATFVSHNAAVMFCEQLTAKERQAGLIGANDTYRLPTEAEWEYACRAGTTTQYGFGSYAADLKDYAWYGGFYKEGSAAFEHYPHRVGLKRPNAWRLCDMHGNVREWCQDSYDQNFFSRSPVNDPVLQGSTIHIYRGGSWSSSPESSSSTYRVGNTADFSDNSVGFRIVRTINSSAANVVTAMTPAVIPKEHPSAPSTPQQPEKSVGDSDGFESLFNGRDLSGWVRKGGEMRFEAVNGEIVGTAIPNTPNGYLCTTRAYSDFELELDFIVEGRLNSGIQIRSESRSSYKNGRVHGYQVEIDPSNGVDIGGRGFTGGLYDEGRRAIFLDDVSKHPATRLAYRPNDWNEIRVVCKGDSIKTWLNGWPATDCTDSMTRTGFIGLQVHSIPDQIAKRIRFRNIFLKDLTARPARIPTGTTPPPTVAPFDATKAKQHQQSWASYLKTDVVKPNSIGMQMTLIPPGEFLMGSSDADIALALKIAAETNLDTNSVRRIQEERPKHRVRLTQPFRLSAHEITIGQFAKFVEQANYRTQAERFGGNSTTTRPEEMKPDNLKINWRTPGQAVTDDSPVTQVSWNDAIAFCNWLSVQEQLAPCYQRDGDSWTPLPKTNGYRLPTEAEWEYACHAGTTTQFWFGDNWQDHDKYGWSNRNAGGGPYSVGLLPANPFGLYDMHGNVWEWCQDWYASKWYEKLPTDDPVGPGTASDRVFRGGGWYHTPAHSRSSYRGSHSGTPSYRDSHRGFRPVLISIGPKVTASKTRPL